MGKIISIYCHKGGVAKTSTVAALASAMVKDGKRVLLVDIDGQTSLTANFLDTKTQEDATGKTIYDALTNPDIKPSIEGIRFGLSMFVGSELMSTWPDFLTSRLNREYYLKNFLAPYKRLYDYILVDCPCLFGLTQINALTAADLVLIPTKGDMLSLKGLSQALHYIELVRHNTNRRLTLLGVFQTFYDDRTRQSHLAEQSIRELLKDKFLNTHIRRCEAVSQAPSFRTDIVSYRPTSNGARDYLALYEEIKPLLIK